MNNYFLNPAHPISPFHPMHPANPAHRMVFDTTIEVPAKEPATAEPKVYDESTVALFVFIALIGGFVIGKFLP